ncbi:glutathione S-transferase U17-like [Corylus avellana]|uniref:glutathione S-transferase U17-like n=1 Tax=Corylus avellana TaxID=13451 RepID=UPI00286A5134|nr:glutathione S-transferase U17-like [Corylus avellana]
MAKSEVKLLGAWPSPFVMRARIALNIKAVEYEFVLETLEPKSPLLLQSNPVYKKIPVLIHADKPICESLIIVQYIDEVWTSAPSILPSDPYDRAIQRFWAAYVDDKLFPTMRGLLTTQGEEARKAVLDQLAEGLALLEEAFGKCSKGKAFFGGDRIGLLDIAFGCMLGWLRATEKISGLKLLHEANTPGLLKWADTFCADAAVKGVMPETEKLVEFSKVIVARMRGAHPPK